MPTIVLPRPLCVAPPLQGPLAESREAVLCLCLPKAMLHAFDPHSDALGGVARVVYRDNWARGGDRGASPPRARGASPPPVTGKAAALLGHDGGDSYSRATMSDRASLSDKASVDRSSVDRSSVSDKPRDRKGPRAGRLLSRDEVVEGAEFLRVVPGHVLHAMTHFELTKEDVAAAWKQQRHEAKRAKQAAKADEKNNAKAAGAQARGAPEVGARASGRAESTSASTSGVPGDVPGGVPGGVRGGVGGGLHGHTGHEHAHHRRLRQAAASRRPVLGMPSQCVLRAFQLAHDGNTRTGAHAHN